MKRIVVHMQNNLFAEAIKASFSSECLPFEVLVAHDETDVIEVCGWFVPDVLLFEVSSNSPLLIDERLRLTQTIRGNKDSPKVVFIVDEKKSAEIAEEVKQLKKGGLIDGFLFGSVSSAFLAALIDSL